MGLALGLTGLLAAGCVRGPDRLYAIGDSDEIATYRNRATSIEYPTAATLPDPRASESAPPRRISELSRDQVVDLTLQDAVHEALENSAILKTRGQFLRPGSAPLVDSGSVFDPALQETEVIFNRQGVEAALSEFDAQYSSSILWGRDERLQNNPFSAGGLAAGSTLMEDTAAYRARLEKPLATGGRVALTNTWNYEFNNSPSRLFPSVYVGTLEAEYRQPLLAGAGSDFTRTAGSVLRRDPFREGNGLDQGVLIARIRNDQALADFQAQVTNLVKDVEDLYWELSLAYHVYHTEVVARNGALRTWRMTKSRFDGGLSGGTAADEAQAADSYFEARSRSQAALADLYNTEGQLRRLIGRTVNDGCILRPIDEAMTASFVPDWSLALLDALARRPELRRQKWELKSLAAQLDAAKSLTRPRLDFVSRYRVNAMGDELSGESDDDNLTRQGLDSAMETMTEGDQTGWNLGLEFNMPIGLRSARTQVRNLELKLAKGRRLLAEQELEISHELAQTFTDLDRWHEVMQSNYERSRAATRRVHAFQSEYDAGRLESVDALLRAQISQAQAENAYFRSLIEYNRSITAIFYRKGTLLERNNVHLAEAAWNRCADDEAIRRAWARSTALPADWLLHTSPKEFVGSKPPLHWPDGMMDATPADPMSEPPPAAPPLPPAPSPERRTPERFLRNSEPRQVF